MARYRGLLKWLPKGCWEIGIVDENGPGIRIQPLGVFAADTLMSQLRLIQVPATRVEFVTGYTCDVYRPVGRNRASLAAESRRFIIMLGTRYMLHGGHRIEWHLYRQRYT